jgi:hypothetical protein
MPEGRSEFAKYMLAYEKEEFGGDSRYTDDETVELYGLQFDMAVASHARADGKMSNQDFRIREEEINGKIGIINRNSYQRRFPQQLS